MRRRSKASDEPAKAQRRKTGARKSRVAPKAVRPHSSSAARKETEVARVIRERDEVLEQQRAISDVLQVISNSPSDGAEKHGFKIKMERSFDPATGEADVFPQEITRALLNLISNGFYAATKREEQVNGDSYEPTLVASTKNLGDRVEIRIRDNGTGMPPEVKEKMFNPFFTTKPAGEGTGLGLSITHDIIVKQHSGSIQVDTQPGEFTEIRIILSRAPAFLHS